MGLRKSFPKERNYEFWNIMMCYLIHMDDGLSEKEKMLFGTLAYRMISKAAEIIPADQVRRKGFHVRYSQFTGAGPVSRESNINSRRNCIACSNSKLYRTICRGGVDFARRFPEFGISNRQARSSTLVVSAT
jgi:hypothetical protein